MAKLTHLIVAALLAAFLAVPAMALAPIRHASVGDFFIRPGKLFIKKGTRVTWTWVGGSGIAHNVTAYKGPVKFHSRTKTSGTYTFLFRRKGTYLLHCTIHPTLMKEKVFVS